jgi:hypothetical protein
VSIRYTAPVRAVHQHARSPIVVQELLEKLATDRPGASAAALEVLVGDLIGHGVLISSLRPSSTSTDGLAHVLERI